MTKIDAHRFGRVFGDMASEVGYMIRFGRRSEREAPSFNKMAMREDGSVALQTKYPMNAPTEMLTMMRRLLLWFFKSRETGAIMIAQTLWIVKRIDRPPVLSRRRGRRNP